jgi:hypothetical protein
MEKENNIPSLSLCCEAFTSTNGRSYNPWGISKWIE